MANGLQIDMRKVLKTAGEREKGVCLKVMDEFPKVAETLLNRYPGILDLLKPEEKSKEAKSTDTHNDDSPPPKAKVEDPTDELVEPNNEGLYEVLTDTDGSSKTMLLADSSVGQSMSDHGTSRSFYLINYRNNKYSMVNTGEFCAYNADSSNIDWKNWWDDLTDNNIKPDGSSYIFVGPKEDEMSPLFDSIREKTRKSNGEMVLESLGETIIRTNSKGSKISRATKNDGEVVYIPKHWKAIKASRGDFATYYPDSKWRFC